MTCTVPEAAMSAAAIAAVNCIALTNVLVRATPFRARPHHSRNWCH